MALRISLIVAILFAVVTIVVSQFVLKPQIQHIIETRDLNKKNWDMQLARANKLDRELKDTQGRLAETARRLEETQNNLASTSAKLKAETERANGLRKQLDETTQRANRAEADLAAWRALGIPVEGVKGIIASERKLREDNKALEAETKMLLTKNRNLQEQLDRLLGKEEVPPVPVGVRGTVLAVDPKYDFVVVSLGENDGIRPRAILLVSRESRLVAKVQVTTVDGNRSVANILPGWKLGEVFEGDLVVGPSL